MGEVTVLSGTDVKSLLDLDELRKTLVDTLETLSRGEASIPARVAAFLPDGLVAAMPGYVPGVGLAAKLVSVFAKNAGTGIPSHQALIVVFDESSGSVVSVMDGTHITAMRTAMTAAVAAFTLARSDAAVLAILGAGVQGASHLEAFAHLFALGEIRVASRRKEHAARLALGVSGATAVATFEAAVRGADIVCCCTDASSPILQDSWIEPGTHVSSVGFGHELDPATINRAEIFVESLTALEPSPAGAQELQGRDPSSVTQLGAVLSGRARGRSSADAVTVFKSVGNAAEDVAAAAVILERARALHRGLIIEL